MLIINDKHGQLCNRLWGYSFFIAFAYKYKIKIFIPQFREYTSYFEDLGCLSNVYFWINKYPEKIDNLIFEVYKYLIKIIRVVNYIVNLKYFRIYIDNKNWTREKWDFELLKKENRIIFMGSWYHQKEVNNLIENKEIIKKLFRPKIAHIRRVDELIDEIKGENDIIIGIHIRRGDYKIFYNGAYVFDDETYKKYMKMLQTIFCDKIICFYLSSNEEET